MTAEPTLRQLRTFLEVAEAGSLSAAARALNLSQPAVSLALRELERLVGVRLLERDGRHPVPTAAGRELIEHARLVRAAMDETMAAVGAYRTGTVGRVRLGTGLSCCVHELPPILAGARQRLPGIEIQVVTGKSIDLLRMLEAGELDLCVMTAAPVSRAVQVTELAPHELLALFPEALAPARATARPEDFAGKPLILMPTGNSTRTLVDGWFTRNGDAPPRPAMEMVNEEAVKALVAAGLGCGVLAEIVLPERRALPGTVVMPLRPALKRRQLMAVRKGKVVDRGLRTLIEEVLRRRGR